MLEMAPIMIFTSRLSLLPLCLTTILLSLTSVDGQFTQRPTDKAVRVGNDVILTCRVADDNKVGFEWRERISIDTGTRIFHSERLNMTSDPSKYAIKDQYDLQIKTVTLSDGGRYQCEEVNMGLAAHAKVIVFDNFTIWTMGLVENRPGNVTFGANFSTMINLPKPVVTVTVNGSNVNVEQTDFKTFSTTNQQSVYNLTGHAIHTARFGDVIEVVISNNSETKYEFRHSVTLDKNNINFGTRNLKTSVNESKLYVVGEKITCSAEGNPPPKYTWTPLTLSIGSKTGNNLVITDEMILDTKNATVQTWTVTASNPYNETTKDITFTVVPGGQGGNNDKSKTGAIVGGVVGGLAAVAVIVGVSVAVTKKKKKKRSDKDRSNNTTTKGHVNNGADGNHAEGGEMIQPYGSVDLNKLNHNQNVEASAYQPEPAYAETRDVVFPGKQITVNTNDYALAGPVQGQEKKQPDVYGKVNKKPSNVDPDETTLVDNTTYAPFEQPVVPAIGQNSNKPAVGQKPAKPTKPSITV